MAEDARIRKTKKKLSEALVALLQEKAFRDISPATLCERAGINRSTFYRNYKNTLQLKTEIEESILSGIYWDGKAKDTDEIREIIEKHLCYLRDNKPTFLAFSTPDFQENIFEKARRRAIRASFEAFDRVEDAPEREEYENLCTFYISALVTQVEDWFLGGMEQSIESLASFLASRLSEACEKIGA